MVNVLHIENNLVFIKFGYLTSSGLVYKYAAFVLCDVNVLSPLNG